MLIFLLGYEDNNYPTHTFLVFHKYDSWYWFENSWDQFRGIHKNESLDLLIQDIKKKHMKLSISLGLAKEENYETLNCIEFAKPPYHLKPQEYIDFIIDSNLKNVK